MYTRWIRGDTREDMSTSILMERSSKLVRRVAPCMTYVQYRTGTDLDLGRIQFLLPASMFRITNPRDLSSPG